MENQILMAAIDYQKRGYSVIPIGPQKKPLIKWEPYQKKKATSEEIQKWWANHPRAMVAIVTGAVSNICAIDVDEEIGKEELSKYIPDSLLIPASQTPRGGTHLYFAPPSPCPHNNARIIPGCDFRGEGGYIIAPPSSNGEGKSYAWIPSLSLEEIEPPPLPQLYINKILNSNGYMRSGKKNDHNRPHLTTNDHKMFIEGSRDEDLFHAANLLVKGGASEIEVRQILERLALSCSPPFPLNEIEAKIQSALKREVIRERNLAQEIREWVMTTNDHFLTTDGHKELQMTTRREFKTFTMTLLRLCEEGIIEKVGNRRGSFRRVDNQAEEVKFLTAPTTDFAITWPLGIHSLCVIYPGNIIVVAGSKSAGKTAFLLNTVKLNQAQHEIIYLNSEMGDTEFRKRLELFTDMQLTDWKFRPYHRMGSFEDLVTGEKKIFIIDFLEVTTDFWKVAQYIQGIHRKLREGIAIIALQKSEAKEAGRGGDFSKEKARLYISLDYLPEMKKNRLKIIDAKAWRGSQNPRGMYRLYKLVNGSKFLPDDSWLE